MARLVVTSAWTTFLALSFGAACTEIETPQTVGVGGASGSQSGSSTGSSTSSTSAAVTSGSSTAVSTGSNGAGGSAPAFVCDPPADPGSIYEATAESFNIEEVDPISMCKYRGDVMLIVNTAAVWGYTPQMAGLQGLEEKFSAEGLHVLGFLSNDFGNQGGTPGQIDTCTDKYNVTFQQLAIDHVIGADAQPAFKWILGQQNPGPATPIAAQWNFHKYLISRTGQLVGHWASGTYPGDDPDNPGDNFDTNPIVVAIKAELAK